MRIFFFLFLFWSGLTLAQDPQFSQYYQAPLYLNPALTGTGDCYRAGLSYRHQWSSLNRPFKTMSAFVDLNMPGNNSGLGFQVLRDNVGSQHLSTSQIDLSYRYELHLDASWSLNFGLQAGYGMKQVDHGSLYFEDQFQGTNLSANNTSDEVVSENRFSYGDFSSGLLLFKDEVLWLGVAAHHLNRPRNSFYADSESLPIKLTVHGGYRIALERKAMNRNKAKKMLVPTFHYKHQGRFDQLDVGLYLLQAKLMTGIWYRGLLLKEEESIRNNDALVVLFGYRHKVFSLTYSYDITTSNLAWANTKGSHELSVNYNFCLDWPRQRKVPKHSKRLPCPDFLK